MEANILAGTYCFSNELMFEKSLTEISDPDTKVKKIRTCYLFDTDWEISEGPDTIEVTLFFRIGVIFDYLCNKTNYIKTEYKTFPCQKRHLLYKKQLKNFVSDKKIKKYFIHNLNNILFSTYSLDNNEEILTVTCNIEGIILTEYHHNFWVGNELNLQPPSRPENYDWEHILKNINIKDAVILFESLLTLIKGICSEKSNKSSHPKMSADEVSVSQTENTPSQNHDNKELEDLKKLVLKLRHELEEKNYIISGLLKYINNRKNPSLEGFSLPKDIKL